MTRTLLIRDSRIKWTKRETEVFFIMILCFVHSWSITFTEENYQGYKGTKMDCFAIRIQRGMKIYPGLQVLQRFLIFIKRNICSLCVYVYAHVSVFSLF